MLMIARTRKLNEVFGNPSDAIIVQVVCWHHLLVTTMKQTARQIHLKKRFRPGMTVWLTIPLKQRING